MRSPYRPLSVPYAFTMPFAGSGGPAANLDLAAAIAAARQAQHDRNVKVALGVGAGVVVLGVLGYALL